MQQVDCLLTFSLDQRNLMVAQKEDVILDDCWRVAVGKYVKC